MTKIILNFLILFAIYKEINSTKCGKAKGGIGNVIGGSKVSPHQYPWVAAMMVNKNGKYEYHCGAVIISKYRILTAAHCIQDKGTKVKYLPRDVRIVIGPHDLNDQFEVGKEIRSVKSILVHPDWNPDVTTFDGDIAKLILEKEIIMNNYVQVVCVWNPLMLNVTSGIIVGYGKSEDESKLHENIPKVLRVPLHTQENCFLKFKDLASISSKRTFCAGSANGVGACLGDSGGGLYVKIQDIYYLRGIISSSLRKEFSCDVNAYSIYTDVHKYFHWIKYLNSNNNIGTSNNQCGTMSSSSGLIQKGSFATRKEFPWMAIIDGNFRTSGALISNKHVVSILSAVGDWDGKKKKYVPPASLDRIKISLGALRPGNENLVPVKPSRIIFHPEYEFADKLPTINIAVIILSTIVYFNEYVRPICLWNFNQDLQYIQNLQLYTVGYGKGATGETTDARKYAKMSIVSQSECTTKFDKQQDFMKKSKTFCAVGSENGYPCHQDESLFVKYNGRWYWRGFSVIRFYLKANPNLCSLSPVLYEDAAQYSDWLKSFIEN